jgi:hypothetical protein
MLGIITPPSLPDVVFDDDATCSGREHFCSALHGLHSRFETGAGAQKKVCLI